MKREYWLLLLGLIAGVVSGLLGVGGGVIVVPALVLFFGYEIKKAVGISLATIVPTVLVALLIHYLIDSSNVKGTIALFIVLGSIPGARIGAHIVRKINSALLKNLFALLLLVIAVKILTMLNYIDNSPIDINYLLLVILGLIGGVSSSVFGIGGGVVIVPALNLLCGLSMHSAIATSLLVIFPTTLSGAIFHKKFGNLNIKTARLLIPAALLGAVIGAIFANKVDTGTLRMIFSMYLILCAVKMLCYKK